MKNVTYVGPFEAVVDADGTEYPNGVSVSVEDALADSLTIRADFKLTPPLAPKGKE